MGATKMPEPTDLYDLAKEMRLMSQALDQMPEGYRPEGDMEDALESLRHEAIALKLACEALFNS